MSRSSITREDENAIYGESRILIVGHPERMRRSVGRLRRACRAQRSRTARDFALVMTLQTAFVAQNVTFGPSWPSYRLSTRPVQTGKAGNRSVPGRAEHCNWRPKVGGSILPFTTGSAQQNKFLLGPDDRKLGCCYSFGFPGVTTCLSPEL